MYDKILLTTDGSEGAETAVDHASEIAKKFDSEVHVLFVADIRTGSPQDIQEVVSGHFEEVGKEAVEKISKQLENEGINVVTHVEKGIPHKNILEFKQKEDIEMIVMSSHGRTGLDRILIGSVTEKVVRNSDIPVLTVGRE